MGTRGTTEKKKRIPDYVRNPRGGGRKEKGPTSTSPNSGKGGGGGESKTQGGDTKEREE